ncbi:MAG TPA: hypothetical protein VFS39_10860 [Nitrospira sp.]|nr:hypothetical protein [Nitrospira sp.]
MTLVRILLALSLLSVAGCLPRPAKLAPVGAHEILPSDQIEVEWPLEWMTFRPTENDDNAKKEGIVLLLSRDGFSLQTIRLTKQAAGADFKYTQKKLSTGMLPQEVAELTLDNIRANPEVIDLSVIESAPATVLGAPGFKLRYTYRGKTGLTREVGMYGCLDRDMLVILSLDAPRRYYFEKDWPVLDKVKDSLRWQS